MESLRDIVLQAVYIIVREQNDINTEEDLNMTICKNLVNEKYKDFDKNIQILNAKVDDGRVEPNGAWVYNIAADKPWVFERFDSIGQAIVRAISLMGSKVLCNGREILFDSYDDTRAFYIDLNGDVKIVELHR